MLNTAGFSKGFANALIIICSTAAAAFSQNNGPAAAIIDTNSKVAVFAPGVVSTPFEEGAATFSPDGNTVYFYQGTIYMTVCSANKVNGNWTEPKVAPFSGHWSDWDPFLSPDGKRLFFVSNRPLEDAPQDKPQRKSHIWYTDKLSADKWSAPRHVDAPFNLDGVNNYGPSVSSKGTLFFCSNGRAGNSGMCSYCAKWLGDRYDEPKLLALNGKEDTQDPFVAPDESYIVFVSGNDIYVSFKQGEGWSTGQKLGPQVNNGDSIWDPTVSPDGKMLYYSTNRIQGLYKRDPKGQPLNYNELQTEMNGILNGRSNILMIPVNLGNIKR
jgi:hypothetical protein